MRLESTVNLLVATLDLNLVRLVRGAMRAADANAAPGGDQLIVPGPTVAPRRRFHPDPVIEPRRHLHPGPVFEPRPAHQREQVGAQQCPAEPVAPAVAKPSASPIQPPWKVLPWENPPAELPRPVHKVKLVVGPPDMSSKGNVIDLFI